jgi:hypothetical protein
MKRNASCYIEQSRPSLQQFLSLSHVFLLMRHQREAVAAAVVPGPVVSMLVVSMLVVCGLVACVQEPIGVEPMCAEASVPPLSAPLHTARLWELPTTTPPPADMRPIHLAIRMRGGVARSALP